MYIPAWLHICEVNEYQNMSKGLSVAIAANSDATLFCSLYAEQGGGDIVSSM